MSQHENVLPTTIVRAIGDKLYDRRKTAALEVEGLVKTLAAQVRFTTRSSVVSIP